MRSVITNRTNESDLTSNSTVLNQNSFFELYYDSYVAYIVVGFFICVFAVVSNIICFLAICTYPKLKHRGNVLVANLVLINILQGLTIHPLTIISVIYRQYRNLPVLFCDWLIFHYVLVYSFMWQECLLAINRFIAIVFPHSYKAISTNFSIAGTIVLGYLIPIGINAYTIFTHDHVYNFTQASGICRFMSDNNYPVIQGAVGIYLPLAVIGVCYTSVFGVNFVRTRQTAKRLAVSGVGAGTSPFFGGSANPQPQHKRKRARLARMLFWSYVWNLVMYLPQPLLSAAMPTMYILYPPAYFYLRWVSQLGVAGNTIVFALLHCDYRKGMLAVLQLKCFGSGTIAPTAATSREKPSRGTT